MSLSQQNDISIRGNNANNLGVEIADQSQAIKTNKPISMYACISNGSGLNAKRKRKRKHTIT